MQLRLCCLSAQVLTAPEADPDPLEVPGTARVEGESSRLPCTPAMTLGLPSTSRERARCHGAQRCPMGVPARFSFSVVSDSREVSGGSTREGLAWVERV